MVLGSCWGVGGQEDCGERETGAGGEIRRIEDADWKDQEIEIRFRFGRGKRGVGGGRVEKEGREGCGGRGGVAAGRQSIIGGRHGCGATCGGQQCRRRDTVVASKIRARVPLRKKFGEIKKIHPAKKRIRQIFEEHEKR